MRICSLPNCNRKLFARKLCQGHYMRIKKTGTVLDKKGNLAIRIRSELPYTIEEDTRRERVQEIIHDLTND